MISFNDLWSVNARINALPYRSEVVDDWSPITAEGGDCDSYATAKFNALVALGWPTSALRLATAFVETGEYHAILIADLEGQSFALDNRYPFPMEFQMLPYRFHKIQIAGSQQWESARA